MQKKKMQKRYLVSEIKGILATGSQCVNKHFSDFAYQ